MARLQTGNVSALPEHANVAVFAYEKDRRLGSQFLFGSIIEKAFHMAYEDGFTGKRGQVTVVRSPGKITRFGFVGLGFQEDATLDDIRRGAAAAARTAVSMNLGFLAIRPTILGSAAASARLRRSCGARAPSSRTRSTCFTSRPPA